MDKKYVLTDETIVFYGHTIHRIKAIKDFGSVKKGDLGGFVESENLSHEGNCWIYDDAKVYGNAGIYDDALVCDDALVYGNADVCGNAKVYDNARIYGTARIGRNARIFGNVKVCDNAKVFGNAIVYGDAKVCGNAKVLGKADIYDNAKVFGNAKVYGDAKVCSYAEVFDSAKVYNNAKVFGNAKVYGDAKVYGNVKVYGYARVCGYAKVYDDAEVYGMANVFGKANIKENYSIKDCVVYKTDSISEIVRVQTGLIPVNGEVIAYKQVNKDLTSFYDDNFRYKIGEWVEAKNIDESNKSCAGGLHFSNANYWNNFCKTEKSTFLIAKIKLEDIITVQKGKIRCRKAFILGKYDIEDNKTEEMYSC